jgi:PKD repeat protein
MGYRLRAATLAGLALTVSACGVHQATTPTATGPSTFATSVTMTANPDSISQDGASQSSIVVVARDASGAALSGLTVRLSTQVAGVAQDFGVLSARSVVTGSDGKANAVYTAPPASSLSGGTGTTVSIIASPIGTDAQTTISRGVDIRLVPPGVILPPAGTPTAAFTVSPTPVTAGVPSTFDATSSTPGTGSAAITSYSWNFGDGSQATGRSLPHTFSAQASFVVTLTVVNDRGVAASTTQTVVVAAGGSGSSPTAAFTFSPASPGVNAPVFFNATVSAPGPGHTLVSYVWTFGDGGGGSGVTVSHVYTAAGAYSVQLKVTDEIGQTNTSSGQSISVGSPPAPSSSFTFSPASPARFDQVVFDASSSSTAQGQTIVDVAWNFGDGTAVVHCPGDPSCITTNGNNRISAHTFQTAATFVINLVVTDSAGRIGSSNKSISIATGDPNVVVTASPSSPNPGTTVNFNSDGTTYFSGSLPVSFGVSFAWTFGDGGTSALRNPSHPYAAVGSYSVQLAVTDNKGRTGLGSVTVTVVAVTPPPPPTPPSASFTFGPPSPKAGVTSVLFDGSGSKNGTGTTTGLTYAWNFGDASTFGPSGTATVNHIYAAAGAYQVTLTVVDTATGLSNTSAAQTVTVVP